MAMNRVQFQKGLSLHDFMAQFGTEAACEAHLIALRWPTGYACSRCGSTHHSESFNGRRIWECLDCRYQSSSIVGTIFEHTKLGLTQWFLAIYLMTQSKNAVACLELKRQLGVSYKTAWLLKHKLLQTMYLREDTRKLDVRVEVDDAYLGGECTGEKRWRGSPNKVPFVAAVQTTKDGRPHLMRLSRVAGFTKAAIALWAEKALAPGTHVVSDGLGCFQAANTHERTHERIIVGGGPQSVQHAEFRWVNTMLGNLKTAFAGTYHAFDYAKYAHRYLAEFAYRFNRRYDLAAMVPRLIATAVLTSPHPRRVICLPEAGN